MYTLNDNTCSVKFLKSVVWSGVYSGKATDSLLLEEWLVCRDCCTHPVRFLKFNVNMTIANYRI